MGFHREGSAQKRLELAAEERRLEMFHSRQENAGPSRSPRFSLCGTLEKRGPQRVRGALRHEVAWTRKGSQCRPGELVSESQWGFAELFVTGSRGATFAPILPVGVYRLSLGGRFAPWSDLVRNTYELAGSQGSEWACAVTPGGT